MEINNEETRIISSTRKTNRIHFNYYVGNVSNLRSDCINDFGVMLTGKFYFHYHVDFVHSQALRTLEFIRCITYNFSPIDSLVVIHNVFTGSRLEYASVAWNNLK
jgi:hypothetical protein